MKLSSLRYIIRDAFQSIRRNAIMTIASVATMSISLLILGSAWLLVLNSQHMASAMESELEINAYLQQELTREEALNLRRALEAVPGVAKVSFVSREEGLQRLQDRFGEETSIVDTLGESNPLPDMYSIKAEIAEEVPQIAQAIQEVEGVDTVRYGQGMVEKLLAFTQWLRTAGIVLVVAIGLGAVFLIATTIRLTVFARRKAISIMKLVGATDWYIRMPFLLEGMIIGFLGAGLAVLCLQLIYNQLVQNIMVTLNFLPILQDESLIKSVYKSLLLIGTSLGAIGSVISMHRFLRI
ncbi:MAG TPA: permease-like cell division protein FtsX [Peptococcaceae bacterium]|jgi:cell division transport system permease protein|nr:ABC transporter permease [Clostridia bacterium]HOB82055.1 permease-like cell division protein FtsX [Peptococcaceae bacterium]HQD54163.1 permease-like cell division protein FtsX [Peptococcaceae bacterium]